jgi:hypothetical protein
MLAAVSMARSRDILASKLESLTVTEDTQDATRLAQTAARLPVMIRVPRKTQIVRVVVQTGESDRIGTAELDRKTIDAAPEAPTPQPKLTARPPQTPPVPLK